MSRFSFLAALRFVITVLGLLSFTICAAQSNKEVAPNYLNLPDRNYEFDFHWQGDSVTHRWEPHAAMLLPVTLPGCDRIFYLQFDLGAPSTVFYKNKLRQIHARFIKTRFIPDSAMLLRNYQFKVGNMPVEAKQLQLLNYTDPEMDWTQQNTVEIIGTLGADFIEDRVLSIDYPAGKFYNQKELPAEQLSSAQWSDFMFMQRTVLLPAFVDSKKTMLFFDTGSSAYSLLTDKATAERLSKPNVIPEKHTTRSWDKTWTATTLQTDDSVIIAKQNLPLRSATYMEGVSNAQIEQMMKMGIGGMTGNKLFVECVLILDTKAKKFTVIRDKK